MQPNELKKLILKNAGDRTKLVDALLAELEKQVAGVQKLLLEKFVNDWVDKLDVDATTGKIKNTLRNKRLLNNVDDIFLKTVKTNGPVVAKTIMDGVGKILDFNGQYFKAFAKPAELAPLKAAAVAQVRSWLGLEGNGWLQGNGYLAKLIQDPKVLHELKNFAMRAVAGQQGYEATKTAVKGFIDGAGDKAGLMQRYYRNFVYDTFSQVDRATAQVYADKLKMDYAVYEGGIIKTTRPFCKERNGKVFTREEIANFNPPTAQPPNYNPFTDLGGYGCRHHLNWIPYAVAVIMRPDLKKD